MTQHVKQTRTLRSLHDASATEREQIRRRYLDWLADPANQELQIRGHMFGNEGEAGPCCAIGGLYRLLEQHGLARFSGGWTFLRLNVSGDGMEEIGLCPRGMYEGSFAGEEMPLFPEDVAHLLGLGVSLETLSNMNDGADGKGHYGFKQMATFISKRKVAVK